LLKYCAECALGVFGLHMYNYAHRDIKPENLLIAKEGHIFLADFGLTKLITKPIEEQSGSEFYSFLLKVNSI
jgi:serine/threonine protein kinase